jgi:hypothetical protein
MSDRPSPSGRCINNILRLADVQEDSEGETRLSVSERRLRDPEVRAAFGDDLEVARRTKVVFGPDEEPWAEVDGVAG